MKSLRLAVFALICAFPIAAQAEVTLRLATPGDPINNPTENFEITASQIDAAVGTTFFSTQADALVLNLAALRQDLEVVIRDHVLLNPKITSVQSVTVLTNPISARLTQLADAIGLSVSGIDTSLSATADGIPVICPSVHFTAAINSTGNGTFDLFTGLIANININNNVNVTGASCSGLFGFIGNILAGIFVDGLPNFIEGKIEAGLQNFLDVNSVQTMFSLAALTQDLDQAIPAGPLKDKVLVVVNDFLALLSQNSGLVLDIEIDPDFYGPTGPLLSLTASHRMPSLVVENTNDTTLITVDSPGAIRHDIYWSGGFIGSTTNGFLAIPIQPQGTQILAVGVSSLIPELKSFPALATVPQNPSCGPQGCFFLP